MSFQRVPAGNGVQWLTEAVQLILSNPLPFALMGLVVAVIAMVPFLGALALAVLAPALYGGVMFAAREQSAGRRADFPQLFQAFREEGKLPRMLMLCLPGLVAGIAIVLLMAMLLGGALLGAGMTGATGGDGTALGLGLGVGGVVVGILALALGLLAGALTFFATPRVMLDAAEPIPAMKDSLQACLANLGACAVFAVLVIVGVLLASLVLGMIPLVGHLLLMVVLVPVLSVAAFVAWRQVYRRQITQEFPPATPPVAPDA